MDLVTTVRQVRDLIREGPDPLGLYWSERYARSYLNKYFKSHRTRVDAQIYLTELLQPIAKMPQYAKKRKPLGLLATRNAKRAKVGGRDKYGAKSIDWNAAAKLADQAAASAVRRATETTYSQGGLYLNTFNTTFNQTGYNMSGLNQSAAYVASTTNTRQNATNQVMVWPLSPMAQVGNTATPGYRKGQRINPVGFRFSIAHTQSLATLQGAVYHWALVRNKGLTVTNNPTQPFITQTNAMALFVPWVQGPIASLGPNGTLPNGDYSSITRWNYQEWNKVKTGTWTMRPVLNLENANTVQAPGATAVPQQVKFSQGYVPIKDANWDYPSPTAITNIKGGDYYFIIWREGPGDTIIGSDVMCCTFELSFKDA